MRPFKHDFDISSEPQAYEGDREYFNAKIAKLQAEVDELKKFSRFFEDELVILKDSLTHSSPQEPRKRGRPSKKTLTYDGVPSVLSNRLIARKGKNEQ